MGAQRGTDAQLRDLVFVVEDDDDVARTICDTLKKFEYQTEHFGRGGELLRRVTRKKPSVCIIDLGLPDLDGLDVLRNLQEMGVATIVVTGRGDVTDRVLGLELGADDYVVKPFEPRELVARIASVLRRLRSSSSVGSGSAGHFSGWAFDVDARSLTSPTGKTIGLSRAEAQLLEAAAEARTRPAEPGDHQDGLRLRVPVRQQRPVDATRPPAAVTRRRRQPPSSFASNGYVHTSRGPPAVTSTWSSSLTPKGAPTLPA